MTLSTMRMLLENKGNDTLFSLEIGVAARLKDCSSQKGKKIL
jgi:hypothetical protein